MIAIPWFLDGGGEICILLLNSRGIEAFTMESATGGVISRLKIDGIADSGGKAAVAILPVA
jgi:hypothetical protein